MNTPSSPVRVLGLSAACALLAGLSLSSCVVGPPPPPVAVVMPAPVSIRVLPRGVHRVWYHGEHCWVRRGVYYRRHPRGGYVVIR